MSLLKPFRIFNCLLVAGIAYLAAPATQVGATCYICNWDGNNFCDVAGFGQNGNQQCQNPTISGQGCNFSGPTCNS